jgi:hypothetical protein
MVGFAPSCQKHAASQRARASWQDFEGQPATEFFSCACSCAHAQRTCTLASCNLQKADSTSPAPCSVGAKRSRDDDGVPACAATLDFEATQLPRHSAAAADGGFGSDCDYDEPFSHGDTLSASAPPPPDLRSPARRATSDYRFFLRKRT